LWYTRVERVGEAGPLNQDEEVMSYKYAGSLYRNGVECAAASIFDYYTANGANDEAEALNLMLGEREIKQEIAENGDVEGKLREAMLADGDWTLPEGVDGYDIEKALERTYKDLAALVGGYMAEEVRALYQRD